MSAITLLQPGLAVVPPRRLLDQVRDTARNQGHAKPAVLAIADWCERFIRFHSKRHAREMGIGHRHADAGPLSFIVLFPA